MTGGEFIAVFIGRPSLICKCQSTRATYGWTDNLYSKRQQSACRHIADWLRESELLRRARDLCLVCRTKDVSIEARNIFHTVHLPGDHRVESFHVRRSADG